MEVREAWKAYLRHYDIPAYELCGHEGRANVHPNEHGHAVLAAMLLRHFRFQPHLQYAGWGGTVRRCDVPRAIEDRADEITFTGKPWDTSGRHGGAVGVSPDSALRLTFTGNRVEVIPQGVSCVGSARIRIDGKSPADIPELYACTRPSKAEPSWLPGLRRVTLGRATPPVVQEWRLTSTKFDVAKRFFAFSLRGSVTGPDGSGSNQEDFVSDSGQIRIAKRDLRYPLGVLKHRKGVAPDAPFTVTWRVVPTFVETWKMPVVPRNVEWRIPFVSGLKDGKHTLEITPNGDGNVAIRALVVHRPPL